MGEPLSYWRDRARRVIGRALAESYPGETVIAKVARIDEAYPFGPRTHHPYKIWRNERKAVIDRLTAGAATSPEERPCPACGARSGMACHDIANPHVNLDEAHASRRQETDHV